jgi:hypothetical protein
MAKIKLADAVRRLNDRYGAALTYQHAYMAAIAGRVPAERDATGRFWLVDDSNLTAMAKALGLGPAKSKVNPKSTAKNKPATVKPAHSRSTRSAA